MTMTLR